MVLYFLDFVSRIRRLVEEGLFLREKSKKNPPDLHPAANTLRGNVYSLLTLYRSGDEAI